ncbi:MAG: NusG domain II-containing protein [Oscillospiraceae bacterium]|jgi:hypothetical protein|nr:NusG domain II-containing protein [Oscillospiraceae bacterium]
MKLLKSTKFWVAAIAVLLAASAVAASALSRVSFKGAVANVYLDGELIRAIALDGVTSGYSFEVEDDDGGHNTITVERGRIRVSDADCPDLICVKQGWISNGVTPVVCLPHRLLIEIVGAAQSFDAAS